MSEGCSGVEIRQVWLAVGSHCCLQAVGRMEQERTVGRMEQERTVPQVDVFRAMLVVAERNPDKEGKKHGTYVNVIWE